MSKGVEYLKFGLMAIIGIFGLIFFKNGIFRSLSLALFAIASLIMLVIVFIPHHYFQPEHLRKI